MQQLVVLEELLILGGLPVAVGLALGVDVAHRGEHGQLLLHLLEELAVQVGLNARIFQQVLAQEVEAGLLGRVLGLQGGGWTR